MWYSYKPNRFFLYKYKIGKMLMTKNNYQIYDRINAGKITGLDNEMNYLDNDSSNIVG